MAADAAGDDGRVIVDGDVAAGARDSALCGGTAEAAGAAAVAAIAADARGDDPREVVGNGGDRPVRGRDVDRESRPGRTIAAAARRIADANAKDADFEAAVAVGPVVAIAHVGDLADIAGRGREGHGGAAQAIAADDRDRGNVGDDARVGDDVAGVLQRQAGDVGHRGTADADGADRGDRLHLTVQVGEGVADRGRQQDDIAVGGEDREAGRPADADDGLVGLGQRVEDRIADVDHGDRGGGRRGDGRARHGRGSRQRREEAQEQRQAAMAGTRSRRNRGRLGRGAQPVAETDQRGFQLVGASLEQHDQAIDLGHGGKALLGGEAGGIKTVGETSDESGDSSQMAGMGLSAHFRSPPNPVATGDCNHATGHQLIVERYRKDPETRVQLARHGDVTLHSPPYSNLRNKPTGRQPDSAILDR